MLLLLSIKCKKLTHWEGHVLSAAPQILCLKLLEEIALKFSMGGEVTSVLKVTLFWDVTTYGLVAKSQQFKRICCLLLQERSLCHPEDEDSMLFQNVSTFFQTTWDHISEHSNLNSPRRGHIKSHGLNFGLRWFLFKRKLLLKTTNFVTGCTHYKELADNTVQAEWNLQSNLGSQMPRIMNNSVYEQIFWTQSVSDDVLCLELWTLLSFDNEDSAVIDDIVSLGKNMGLEVNNEVGLKQSQVVTRDRKKKKNPLPNNNISLPHYLPLTPSTLPHTTFHLCQLSSLQVR